VKPVTNRVLFVASALLVTVHAGVLAHAAGEAPAKGEQAGPSRAVTSDIIDAVAEEIERAMAGMQIPGEPKPYFVGHKLTEVEVNDVVASLGATTWKQERHFVTIEARVHVGDYQLDSSNFVIANAEATDGVATFQLPMEATPRIARRAAWLVTDAAYKEALELFRAKLDARRGNGNGLANDRPSYTAQAPLVREEPVLVPALDPAEGLEKQARTVSEVFRAMPHIRDSRVAFTSFLERRWYINSEGTRAHDTRRVSGVIITATTQAEDGQELALHYSRYGHTAADLPALAELVRAAENLGRDLQALRTVPVMENYAGPVLFEGLGAADIVRTTLASQLGGTPLPEGLSAGEAKQLGGDLVGRIGLRVISPLLSLIDDPTATHAGGGKRDKQALIGGYQIDDEGVPAQRVEVIAAGMLKALLSSRTPSRQGEASNGHARRGASGGVFRGSATNLFVEGKQGQSSAQLKRKLLAEAQAQGLQYALIIRRLDDPAITGTPELTMRELLHLFTTTDPQMPPPAVQAYKVFPNGKEQLVRGVQLRPVEIRAWRDIMAVGNTPTVANFLAAGEHHLVQKLNGVGNGEVPSSGIESSVVTPDLLFKELEVTGTVTGRREPPLVPSPRAP
jgi:TldD protein